MHSTQIAWDTLSSQLVQGELETLPLEKLGLELQRFYYEVIIRGEEAQDEELTALIVNSVESTGEVEAEWLSDMYEKGHLPRASHAAHAARLFLSKIGKRLRRALCAELREHRNVALSTRETLVLLAPTIVVVLELPAEYAALAVPLSVVLSKITLNAFCDGVDDEVEQESFVQERIRIARKTVLYLQEELSRYRDAVPPPLLQESLERAEARLFDLESRIDSSSRGGEPRQIES